jgi:hypothetical protein
MFVICKTIKHIQKNNIDFFQSFKLNVLAQVSYRANEAETIYIWNFIDNHKQQSLFKNCLILQPLLYIFKVSYK